MPALEELKIKKNLQLINVRRLVYVENFPLVIRDNPRLERISNNPSLEWTDISRCPVLKELDGLPSLRSLEWWDWDAEALPEYLREAKLKKLHVDCSRSLLKLIALQDESSEWGKIHHVHHRINHRSNWYNGKNFKCIGAIRREDEDNPRAPDDPMVRSWKRWTKHIYFAKFQRGFERNSFNTGCSYDASDEASE
uniref:FBD domain-containing protein n=1 Tax=Setaria italica TaxID=4555 RepID=K4AJM8_SETIT